MDKISEEDGTCLIADISCHKVSENNFLRIGGIDKSKYSMAVNISHGYCTEKLMAYLTRNHIRKNILRSTITITRPLPEARWLRKIFHYVGNLLIQVVTNGYKIHSGYTSRNGTRYFTTIWKTIEFVLKLGLPTRTLSYVYRYASNNTKIRSCVVEKFHRSRVRENSRDIT